jgi:hypothetical protein
MLLSSDIFLQLLVLLTQNLDVHFYLFYFLFAFLSCIPDFAFLVMELGFDVYHVLDAVLGL